MYGSASRALRRGGDGKNFLAGRVSPSGDLRTQLLRLNVRNRAIKPRQTTSGDPFPPIRYNYYTRILYTS